MKTRIYMNHLIKGPNPHKDPVIAIETEAGVMYCNSVDFLDENGEVVLTLKSGEIRGHAGHKVKAWIETDLDFEMD